MLGLSLLILLATASRPAEPTAIDVPEVPVKPDVAAARVAACGFKQVRPKFDGTLQENVVEVLDVTASTAQLRCAALASLGSYYYVVFPAPVEQRYEALYWPLSREKDKADARAWLDKRGLLSRLPTYDPKRTNETVFARSLEALCGPKAAGTLLPMAGMATFTSEALGTVGKDGFKPGKLDDETLRCLINAAAAADYPLGFVGKEAVAAPPK